MSRALPRCLAGWILLAASACSSSSPSDGPRVRADIAAVDARIAERSAELEEASASGNEDRVIAISSSIQKLQETRERLQAPVKITPEANIQKLELMVKSLERSVENLKKSGNSMTLASAMKSLEVARGQLESARVTKAKLDEAKRRQAASMPSRPASLPGSRPTIRIGGR